ncbi:MAG: exopolysaccharide production protein ExoQ [Actinomycetota bacterium]|nr:exopolysaccharide production protein ExoQ [Actinomycetota bacterium]
MAALAPGARLPELVARAGVLVHRHAADVLVVGVLAYWATLLTWGTGGREPRDLSLFAIALLVATLVVRPWSSLGPAQLVLANSLGLAAVVVILTAPTGWEGRFDAASYAVAGQLYLVGAAWATDVMRKTLLLVVIAGAAGLEFARGWLAWWGTGDPAHPFVGTFYWHNQAGAFLAVGAVAAAALVVADQRPWRLLGWAVAPLAGTGVLLSSSRGSELALALGAGLLAVGCCFAPGRLLALLRLGAVTALTYGVSVLVVGPPFFPTRVSPLAATVARGDAQPLTGSTNVRLEYWRHALSVFREWPVTGAGFHSFLAASQKVGDVPAGTASALVHNGFLQAASDGGLVLLLPLTFAAVSVAFGAVRMLPGALRERQVTGLAALCLLAALAFHSMIDFDWSYPALLSLAALVAVLASRPTSRTATSRIGVLWGVVGAVLLVFAAVAAWGGDLHLSTGLGLS